MKGILQLRDRQTLWNYCEDAFSGSGLADHVQPDISLMIRKQKGEIPKNETSHTQKPSELLWINERAVIDPRSSSGSLRRRSINRHVQRFRKEHERVAKDRGYHTNIANHSKWRLSNITSPAEASRPESKSAVRACEEASSTGPLRLTRQICGPGEAIDPFVATASSIDSSAHQLLQYYIHVLVPSKWHVDSKSNAKLPRVEAASMSVIRGCLASELHLYSLLASMSSRMQNLERWSAAPPTELFIDKALRGLRKYFESSPDFIETQVFYDMFFLCTAEAYRFDLPASMTHLRAIAQLVEVTGGLSKLASPMLLETLVQGDIMLAVEQLSSPVFSLTWDPGPFPQTRWRKIKAATTLKALGLAILNLSENNVLPRTVRKIVQEAVQCVQVAQYVWTHCEPTPSDTKWIFLRYLAIVHRLLRLELASMRAEAFRIAMIMWLMIIMTSLGIRRAVKLIVPNLRRTLLALGEDESHWGELSGLLLWILNVGSIASAGSSDEPWFLLRLNDLIDHLHIRTDDQLRSFLRSYFVLEPVQSVSLDVLCYKLAMLGSFAALPPENLPSEERPMSRSR